LESWFDTVEADIGDPAIDATFTVEGSDLNITQDSTGTGADRDAVTNRIFDALRTMEGFDEDLPTDVAEPRITKADLEANEDAVLNILSSSVGIRFEDERWDLNPEEISQFMIFESSVEDGRAVTSVDFDRSLLGEFLRSRFSEEINRMPVNASVQFYNGKLSA